MRQKFELIDEYIAIFPNDVQEILQKIRKIIKEIVPEAEEAISYGIPTFKMHGTYVIYFAGFKNHVSLYPIPQVSESFKNQIAKHIKGKGTVQFPLEKPIPYDLIKQFVKFSKEANEERYKSCGIDFFLQSHTVIAV
jgi:uncharacterized protein YdhG (YjbR/CyaY superfamily)